MVNLEEIGIYRVELPRKGVFRIATGSSSEVRNVVIRIRGEGEEGWGAGAPTRVTGETLEGIWDALHLIKGKLEGTDFETPERAIEGAERVAGEHPSALAAFDIAIYDLFSRLSGMPLSAYLSKRYGGTQRSEVLTDMTIGINGLDKTVEEAKEYVRQGFRALKIKIGLDFEMDMERIRAVRDAVGDGILLWADANQGYSVEEGVAASRVLRESGYIFFEQPVRWDDFNGLKEVRGRSEIPVFADESAKSLPLVERIGMEGIADGINIKLMKFGGILRSIKAMESARRYGLKLMVGCMGETSLTVSAGVHLAMAFPEIEYADLDSHFTIEGDMAEGIMFEHGALKTRGNGLGIRVREEVLKG